MKEETWSFAAAQEQRLIKVELTLPTVRYIYIKPLK